MGTKINDVPGGVVVALAAKTVAIAPEVAVAVSTSLLLRDGLKKDVLQSEPDGSKP